MSPVLSRLTVPLLLLALLGAPACILPPAGAGHHHDDGHDDDHEHGPLHFSHPLVAESPSPDSKIRLDLVRTRFRNEDGDSVLDHSLNLEYEHAFSPGLSVELDVPYVVRQPRGMSGFDRLGTVGVGVKAASFAFSDCGLLLGGGLELGLPTGNDNKGLGSDHIVDVEPYLSLGWKHDDLEVVSFLSLGYGANTHDKSERERERAFNLSFLYHACERVAALVELDQLVVLSGEEEGTRVWNVTPGVKFTLDAEGKRKLGIGARMPITGDHEIEKSLIVSYFQHF